MAHARRIKRIVAQDDARRRAAGEELADVLCYALALANELGLDVATAVPQDAEERIEYSHSHIAAVMDATTRASGQGAD